MYLRCTYVGGWAKESTEHREGKKWPGEGERKPMLPGHAPVGAIFSIVFPKRGRSTERHALDLTNTCMYVRVGFLCKIMKVSMESDCFFYLAFIPRPLPTRLAFIKYSSPCGPRLWVTFKRPWALTQDTTVATPVQNIWFALAQGIGSGSHYVQRSYENLFQQVKRKKSQHKARFEPATFCFTHNSPNHYTTDVHVVAAANHYFPPFINKP